MEDTWVIQKSDIAFDTTFHGANKEIIKLHADGRITVNGDPDDAAKLFIKLLEEIYGSLPHRLSEANKEIERFKRIKELLFQWISLRDTNIKREVIHCSFPFPCECCIEKELVTVLK